MNRSLAPLSYRVAISLSFPLFFVVGTLLIMPLSLFMFDNDEGINVIKAVLMADGYPLYTETWSDQPPIFTQLLAIAFAIFGETMQVARLLVLALTTLFIWAYTNTIRLHLGVGAAWVALLLLMLSDNFLRLSVSVMIGLPALSLAMVGIYLLQRYKTKPQIWLLLLAALLMGVSMQTKMFTVILVPVIGLDLLDFGRDFRADREQFWQKMRGALLWGAITIVTYISIGIYYNAFNIDMLLGSHLNDSVRTAYQDEQSWDRLRNFLIFDYGHVLAALLGVFAIVQRRAWHGLFPLGWLLLAFLLLLNHRPIWYHHYQLLSIPLCWLAAYSVFVFFKKGDGDKVAGDRRQGDQEIGAQWQRVAAGLLIWIVCYGLIYARSERTVPYYNQRVYDQEIVNLLMANAGEDAWVFSDRATYPFYAGVPVPPEIAVFSRKRFSGENLNNQILLDVMERYQPNQVLLTRFKDELLTDAEFAAYLNAHYTTVQENPDYVYYLRDK